MVNNPGTLEFLKIRYMTSAVRTTFLRKVAVFDITHMSPKHPQSATGSAIIIYNVSGSMPPMIRPISHAHVRL